MKERFLAASSADTIRSRARTGKPARKLRSAWTDAWAAEGAPSPLPLPTQYRISEPALFRAEKAALAGNDGARELATYFVGQIVGSMNSVQPTRRVVLDMIDELIEATKRTAVQARGLARSNRMPICRRQTSMRGRPVLATLAVAFVAALAGCREAAPPRADAGPPDATSTTGTSETTAPGTPTGPTLAPPASFVPPLVPASTTTVASTGETEQLPAGRTFLAKRATSNGSPRPFDGSPRLTFTGDGLSFSAGCNAVSGSAKLRGGVLIVDRLVTTATACPEPKMAQDSFVSSVVAGRPTFQLSGDELVLRTPSAEIHLLDRRVADPDRPLEGTQWRVAAVGSAQDKEAQDDVTRKLAGRMTAVIEGPALRLRTGNDGGLDLSAGSR